jgi:hypothetical protein
MLVAWRNDVHGGTPTEDPRIDKLPCMEQLLTIQRLPRAELADPVGAGRG